LIAVEPVIVIMSADLMGIGEVVLSPLLEQVKGWCTATAPGEGNAISGDGGALAGSGSAELTADSRYEVTDVW